MNTDHDELDEATRPWYLPPPYDMLFDAAMADFARHKGDCAVVISKVKIGSGYTVKIEIKK